jgi:hypothetical protein
VGGAESGHMRSIEVLQLALLGTALLLVAARLRVLALRRRVGHAPPRRLEAGANAPARHANPHTRRATPAARRAARGPSGRATPVLSRRAEADEWPFPDPSVPAPTGLLPSTASARRRARELAMPGDRG